MMKKLFFILLIISMAFAIDSLVAYKMEEKSTMNILENGDAEVIEEITLSISAYQVFLEAYPTTQTFARFFEPINLPIQIEDLDIQMDDMKGKITATYIIKGASVNQLSHWNFILSNEDGASLSAQTGNILIFVSAEQNGEFSIMSTTTVTLPENAYNIEFNKNSNTLKYSMPSVGGEIIFLTGGILFVVLGIVNFVFFKY